MIAMVVFRAFRWVLRAAGVGVFFTFMLVAVFRVAPLPSTPLMHIRVIEGLLAGEWTGIVHLWMPYERISPHVFRAVVAAEDARFMRHHGIDWRALEDARKYNLLHQGRKLRGASTITMQTAKNAFLWHGRTYVRKALEAWFTFLIETLWGKRRILEVYVNVIETGPGLYGIEAAARTYFNKPAAELTRNEAALIAAVLPNPRRWSPAAPTRYIQRRSQWVMGRMNSVAIP
jgi:monofunctional glycosyltransferase